MTLVRTLSTPLDDPSLEQRAVNALRVLAMDAVQRANSGHPGLPLGAADIAYVLFSRFVRFDPQAPDWPDRDRFVLSGGHGSMLQYALLHLLDWTDHTPEKLNQPTLWLNGFHDFMMCGETQMADPRCTTFFASGHYPHVEEPERFVEVLGQFLDGA